MPHIKLKLNKELKGFHKGQKVVVECDENDIPRDRYWRNRLKDAERDGCVEIVKKSEPRHVEPEPEEEAEEEVEEPKARKKSKSKKKVSHDDHD